MRRPGGGRKALAATDASLVEDLRGLAEPPARGDPASPLRWTCRSPSKLAQGLRDPGQKIGRTLVGELLRKEGCSLQSNAKTLEGSDHPDRDAQFKRVLTKDSLYVREQDGQICRVVVVVVIQPQG